MIRLSAALALAAGLLVFALPAGAQEGSPAPAGAASDGGSGETTTPADAKAGEPATSADQGINDTASAEDPPWRTGMALIGEPALPADFEHFPYVNPDAPKGGVLRLSSPGSFDNFNILIPHGELAPGLGYVYETLMTSSLDELNTSSEYGLIAEAVQYPADFSWVKYRLRPQAKWHDGAPLTADDVIWSFEKAREISPFYRYYYSHVTKAEKTGDHEVRFTFDQAGNRELPQIIGQLMVLPKHWWEGKDDRGRQRDITKTTLEAPLGSGPYRVKSIEPGRRVTYERVKDAWAANLPVNVGTDNFDEVRFEQFRDSTVALEAFKADQFDWRTENSAKNWATGYDFPARREGKVILEEFPDRASGIMQAFVLNLRRDKFKDPRVRRALNLAFDFETLNRTTFYDQYKRVPSFFAGTELASSGLPQGQELAILESVRDKIPPSVFTTPYANPVNGDTGKLRDNLRQAVRLLEEAGWKLEGRRLVNAETGEPLTIEFLIADPSFERIGLPYQQNLARIGIDMRLRTVDSAQYENRIRSFDFDMLTSSWPQSLSPGNEQREFWGSDAADRAGSRNVAGIKDPGIDALIDKVIFAKDRDELVAATRALDRVLLAHDYVVPQWYLDVSRTARWDRFSHPAQLPKYSSGFPTTWWYDVEKAAKIGRVRQ